MGWVDSHCHLQLDDRDPTQLLSRASEVDWVVVPGVDATTSRAALDLAARFPDRVLATAGLHPHEASSWDKQEAEITELAHRGAAVGETGLDFYRNLASSDDQRRSFEGQIRLAESLGKPVIVHCRDAFAEVYEILERAGTGSRAILHCWTGGRRWTKRFLPLGCWFSFAGPIAFETGETIRLAAELIPPERALVETDTPYLAPPPHRHKLNEPAYVAFVGEALAEVWSLPLEQVAKQTSANAATAFDK
ncbi:MAG TPA: TatD family hydrolase [Acidimicrobiia bacterium]|nr:TatD family hydrolase [Acidimicrobiia bacterium]